MKQFLYSVYNRRNAINTSAQFIINRLFIILFFVILVVYASREISDLDLWLHLKTGETIVRNRMVPLFDIFSFSMQDKPWINHAWLFQVIAHLFYKHASFDGLIFMQNIVLVSTFLVLLFMGLKNKNHIFVFIVLYLTLLSSAYRFMIRPDIFSLFFLALYLAVIKKYVETKSKIIFILPVVQILWTNMHGFFFTGPLFILIFLIGEGLKNIIKLPYEWKAVRRLNSEQIKTLLIILFLTFVATFVNPHVWSGAFYPFAVLTQIYGKGKIFFQYIQELAKPFNGKNIFYLKYFTFYKVMILALFFSFRINYRRIDVTHIILMLLALGASLLAIRNIAYFNIIAAYLIFSNVEEAMRFKQLPVFKFNSAAIKNIFYYGLVCFLFIFPISAVEKILNEANFSFKKYELKSSLWGMSDARYPEKAVDFLLENKFPEIMFNDFNSGAYLIGRTFPKRRVFIDGRTEFYGPDFFSNYVNITAGKKDAVEKMISQYDIKGFFLINPNNDLHPGLIRYLVKSPSWTLVYFDEFALIFLKDVTQNLSLINKYRIDLNKRSAAEPDFLKLGVAFRFPWPYLQRAKILNSLGFHESAANEARVALDIMPNNAQALSYLGDYFLSIKDYNQAFKYIRNSLVYAPRNTHTRCQLALTCHYLKDNERAQKTINGLLKKGSETAEAYYTKALMLDETDHKSIKELLKKAIKIAPKEPKYHIKLGNLLEQDADLEGAKKEWEAAFEYDCFNNELINKLK